MTELQRMSDLELIHALRQSLKDMTVPERATEILKEMEKRTNEHKEWKEEWPGE